MKPMSPWQFTIFRIVFGLYLAVHFAGLAPWAAELFGAHGVMPDASLNPTHGLFPNPLDAGLPDAVVTGFVWLLSLLSLLFAAGIWRRTASLLLWFGWACLFHRNNLIANPSIPYVGLLLLFCAIIPPGEPWSRGKTDQPWYMPVWVFRSAWILMAAGYTFSGYTKLHSPSWTDGSALRFLLENPLARPGLPRDWMLALRPVFLAIGTWIVLGAELLFAPLAMWKKSRPWIWLLMVVLHIGIVLMVDFADLSLGMLMIHFFTFDPAWLPARKGKEGLLKLAFDGECLMCNNSVRFLANEDSADTMRFLTLQSPLGQDMMKRSGVTAMDSLLLEADGKLLSRSDGAMRLLDALGGHWRVFSFFGRWVPRPLRDGVYDFIAAHRLKWFGKADVCSLPSEAVRSRLISGDDV